MIADECDGCDRRVWFAENSAAQGALGRLRELAQRWDDTDHLGPMRRYRAAAMLRAAIDGDAVDGAR